MAIGLIIFCLATNAQTTIGIGLYPTGTEAGLGFRLNKDKKLSADGRITKANFYSDSKTGQSAFITELCATYRAVFIEKVRFHLGIGYRGEWNLVTSHKHGAVAPIGVEAFPFPFQNAGLLFEVAPFYVFDNSTRSYGGMRTVAGFVFYFPCKKITNQVK